jgi:hypothetical protein
MRSASRLLRALIVAATRSRSNVGSEDIAMPVSSIGEEKSIPSTVPLMPL